ncbi:MAG: hypothetical protein AAGA27_01060 [Pseudomonadota bacterium]
MNTKTCLTAKVPIITTLFLLAMTYTYPALADSDGSYFLPYTQYSVNISLPDGSNCSGKLNFSNSDIQKEEPVNIGVDDTVYFTNASVTPDEDYKQLLNCLQASSYSFMFNGENDVSF